MAEANKIKVKNTITELIDSRINAPATSSGKFLKDDFTWDTPTGSSSVGTYYGTSSTTASNTVKVVTCDGFTLEKGAMISVLFSTANTADAPILNVNSTTAKPIYVGSSIASTTNPCKWAAGSLVTFIYDGTNYRLQSIEPSFDGGAWYGTCSTTATTAAKVVTCTNFRLKAGATITIQCTTAQEYASGSITLNVNSTGDKTVYYNNTATSSTNVLSWDAGDLVQFIYDGNYWRCNKVVGGGGGTTIVQKPTVEVDNYYLYDGTAKGPTITGLDTTNTIVTNATKTAVGNYTLTIALKNSSTMVWNDLTNAPLTYDYKIVKGFVYGVHVSSSEGAPTSKITYLRDAQGMTPAAMNFSTGKFDYGSWENAFFMPKPCMVKYDGTVDYYLDPDDYTKKEDGTASDVTNTAYGGNAMMEWGQNDMKIWIKQVPDSSDPYSCDTYIASYQEDSDYHDWSFHNANGVSIDHFYTPIYNGSLIDSKLRSISGQAVMKSQTAPNEYNYAIANNVHSKPEWMTEIKSDIDLIDWLLVLMFKTTNYETALGCGLIHSGSESINNGFRTGVHNDKGLFYGTNSGAASTYTNAVKVFGMENWYGFQGRRYLGHIMINGTQYIKNTYGTEDGSTTEGYNFTGSGYKSISNSTPGGSSGGYLSQMLFTEDGMIHKTASGSATTHYCDGLWFNNSITSVPVRGGVSYCGSLGGPFSVYLCNSASHAYWDIGASLSCKPLA